MKKLIIIFIFFINNFISYSQSAWTLQYSNTKYDVIYCISCLDNKNCWAIGGIYGLYPNHGSSAILKTTNGGINWLEVPYNFKDTINSYEPLPNDIKFFDKNNGCLIGNDFPFYTMNGGELWNKLKLVLPCTFRLQQINYINSNLICLSGFFGFIFYSSSDNGITWLPKDTNTIGYIYSMSFPDSLNGWMVGCLV